METHALPSTAASAVRAMDNPPQDLVEQLTCLETLPDQLFGPHLFALIFSMECSFRDEEARMEELRVPELHVHREQHARVLSALHHVVPDVMLGRYDAARHAIELLQQWVPLDHAAIDAEIAVKLDLAQASWPRIQRHQ